jgi:hypothetical protein
MNFDFYSGIEVFQFFAEQKILLFYIFRRCIVGSAGGLYERESPREAGKVVFGHLPRRQENLGNAAP